MLSSTTTFSIRLIAIAQLFFLSRLFAFRAQKRRLAGNISARQPPPSGTGRYNEFQRAEYCSQLATIKDCLDDEYCQALVWPSPEGMLSHGSGSPEGMLSRHIMDHRSGPTVCCEPLQEAKMPRNSKYRRKVWLDEASAVTRGKDVFSVSKKSPCIETVCSDDGRKDWCSLKQARLCPHASGDYCKSLELFEGLPTSNIGARTMSSARKEALELEEKLAHLDQIVEQGYRLYLAATTDAGRDNACSILAQGHTGLQSADKVGNPFVGKYIGFDEHWFHGSANYFKDISGNINDITSINVMITGVDVGFMSTTNLQTLIGGSWGPILDGMVEMYRKYQSGQQAARQMIPKVQQTCNAMACLAQEDRAVVPIIKPLFDEYLGTAKCSPCKPSAFCQAAGDSCGDLLKAVGIISQTCDIIMPRVQVDKTKSWETARSLAPRKGGGDFCFADAYFPGVSEAFGGRLSDLLGEAIHAFWSRLRLDIAHGTVAAGENQKVIDAATAALVKAEAQCG